MKSCLKSLTGMLVVTAACGISAMADATTALFLSREDLVRISDVIVRVKVGRATTIPSDDKTTLITRTHLDVTQVLKGHTQAHTIVEQFGGKYNGKTQRVLGDAQLTPGEDAVIFLKRGDNATMYFTVLAQSVYHIDDHGLARRTLDGLTLVKRTGDKVLPLRLVEQPETVESLMTDVKRLAGGK